MEYNDEQDRKFFDALQAKQYDLAIYYISPRLYHQYLMAGRVSAQEREALERQMRVTLSQFWLGIPKPKLALMTLERWFGFGSQREVSPYTGSDRARRLADLDAQKVSIVESILDDPALTLQDRVEASLRVARIEPDSTMGWGECRALADFIAPYQWSFQFALERWCADMYDFFKHSALGGMH